MSVTETISIDRLPAWLALRVKSLAPAVQQACLAAAHRGKSIVVGAISATKPFPPVDRGSYRASWQVEREETGAVLFSDAPHAAFIEYGTRPHWPPLAPLIDWVERKKIAKGNNAYAVARAIQLKIARRGTAPRKVLARSLAPIEKALGEELDRALSRAVEGR